jgi:hypothetical protein
MFLSIVFPCHWPLSLFLRSLVRPHLKLFHHSLIPGPVPSHCCSCSLSLFLYSLVPSSGNFSPWNKSWLLCDIPDNERVPSICHCTTKSRTSSAIKAESFWFRNCEKCRWARCCTSTWGSMQPSHSIKG